MPNSFVATLAEGANNKQSPGNDGNAGPGPVGANDPDTDVVRSVFGPPAQAADLGTLGPYRILRTLGQGGMGTVYLAEDTRLGRRVALKLCHRANTPSSLERFRREARAAAALRHKNICPVYECDVHNGVPYFTMACIEGPTLDKWLRQRGGIAEAAAARLVRTLALAMQFAHERGVVHRDLKPANIAFDQEEPVILDFGLARYGDQCLTLEGSVMGTPTYMAPEQVKGDLAATGPACDIFALGAILYEMLTGRPRFEGPALAVLHQVLHATPPAPRSIRPEVDPRLEAICLRCLAQNPSDRWTDMAALAGALGDWLKTAPGETGVEAIAASASPPGRDTSGVHSEQQTAATLDENAEAPTEPMGRAATAPRPAERSSDTSVPGLASFGAVVAGSGILAVVLTCAWFGTSPRKTAPRAGSSETKRETAAARTDDATSALPAVVAKSEPVAEHIDSAPRKRTRDIQDTEAEPTVPVRPGQANRQEKQQVTATTDLRIVQAPQVLFVKPGQKVPLSVRVAHPANSIVRVKLVDLMPGLTATELVLPPEQDSGVITVYADIDRGGNTEETRGAVLRATANGLADTSSVQITLDKREALTPAGTVRGYLHELDIAGSTIAVIDPPSPPMQLRVAPGVQVRTLTSGNRESLAGLRLDRFVVVKLGRSADGTQLVMAITEQAPPFGYPPSPRDATPNPNSPRGAGPMFPPPPPPPPPPPGAGRPPSNRRTTSQ